MAMDNTTWRMLAILSGIGRVGLVQRIAVRYHGINQGHASYHRTSQLIIYSFGAASIAAATLPLIAHFSTINHRDEHYFFVGIFVVATLVTRITAGGVYFTLIEEAGTRRDILTWLDNADVFVTIVGVVIFVLHVLVNEKFGILVAAAEWAIGVTDLVTLLCLGTLGP
ncbi:hypothetical protein MTO96_025164 [Rhipicephalus appendiculatus]